MDVGVVELGDADEGMLGYQQLDEADKSLIASFIARLLKKG